MSESLFFEALLQRDYKHGPVLLAKQFPSQSCQRLWGGTGFAWARLHVCNDWHAQKSSRK